jgi:hypothetical protein
VPLARFANALCWIATLVGASGCRRRCPSMVYVGEEAPQRLFARDQRSVSVGAGSGLSNYISFARYNRLPARLVQAR